MLGERGLWYKMNLFEYSARIPLVMAGPGIVTGEAENACPFVELLLTSLDIAWGPTNMLGEPIDGRSLMPLAKGEVDPVDEAIGEYCAEMASYPVVMIRREKLKYVHCDIDPPQLYDLAVDPLETKNLAQIPDFYEVAKQFANEVAIIWNGPSLQDATDFHQRVGNSMHLRYKSALITRPVVT
jgi:choline-sulfatase